MIFIEVVGLYFKKLWVYIYKKLGEMLVIDNLLFWVVIIVFVIWFFVSCLILFRMSLGLLVLIEVK